MQIVTAELIAGKTILLRLDLDVPLSNGKVVEDFRLKAGLSTLKLCLQHAKQVIIMGHLGRPEGKVVKELSVAPIYDWLENQLIGNALDSGKLKLLENLRFEAGEDRSDPEYAKQLASFGDFFVNEAFAAHHPAASITELPKLLPHAAGLRFAEEVARLSEVRNNPQHPLVAIIGGVKIEDKLPAILALSQKADYVLVGGKLVNELKQQPDKLTPKIILGDLNETGTDITPQTIDEWSSLIAGAKMIVWNGPLGKVEDSQNNQSEKIAQAIINSGAESIVGGGDTVGFLGQLGLLEKFNFVSTGGGAMLKFLEDGTLPAIEALN